jgi:hypothetical protein
VLEVLRQPFPARHLAYFQGDVWALARLGSGRQCMTNIVRAGVVVERHLASWERCLAESQGDRRGVRQTLATPLFQQLGPTLSRWDALWAAVETTLVPKVRGQMPGVQKWHAHSGDPARGASLVGHPWALRGVVSAWGKRSLCWPLLARLRPGPLPPWGVVAGAAGVQRLDCWTVVVARVRELRQSPGDRPLRVVADAHCSTASCLNPRVAAGSTVSSRGRRASVGWEDPAPGDGKRPRGRPRTKGRLWKLAALVHAAPLPASTVTS